MGQGLNTPLCMLQSQLVRGSNPAPSRNRQASPYNVLKVSSIFVPWLTSKEGRTNQWRRKGLSVLVLTPCPDAGHVKGSGLAGIRPCLARASGQLWGYWS